MSTWLITGASSGIGRAVATKLLSAGHRVAAFARDPRSMDELATAYPNSLWTAQVDVTDTIELRRAADRAFAELGHIDVLFSNAGSGAFGAAEELADAEIEQQIALNMVAPIQLIRSALPHLRAQGGGRIIQMSTMGGQLTTTGGSMYHASKWGIEGFTEALMGEVAAFGIAVTLVEPGNVRTPFGSALSIAPPIDAYAETPVGQVRRYIEAAGGNLTATALGDPGLVADAIIAVAAQTPAPRRLALGSDAFDGIRAALVSRLAELDEAKVVSESTDFPAGA